MRNYNFIIKKHKGNQSNILTLNEVHAALGLQQLEQEIESLGREKEEWINKVNSLKNGGSYLETLAREKLGMIAADEKLLLPSIKAPVPAKKVDPNKSAKNKNPKKPTKPKAAPKKPTS